MWMNWNKEETKTTARQLSLMPDDMTKDEKKIFAFIFAFIKEQEQSTIDEIALHCDCPQSKLAIVLPEMEMKNILVSLPRKTYKLIKP